MFIERGKRGRKKREVEENGWVQQEEKRRFCVGGNQKEVGK